MIPVFYVRTFFSRNAAEQQAAERAFIERAQLMGYAPTVFDGDDVATSEFMHVSTRRAEPAISCGAIDAAIRRAKAKNPQPFADRAANVSRIAEVLSTLRDGKFDGMVVYVNAESAATVD